jgi:hypothetical protein
MNHNILQTAAIFFVLLLSFSCDTERNTEDIPSAPLQYDPALHVQGTFIDTWGYTQAGYAWEVIIDLESGAFDTIPGTGEPAGGFFLPVGPDRLTDFENNRRIYMDRNNTKIVVQDLESLEKKFIDIADPDPTQEIYFPLYLAFGNTSNELFAYAQYPDKIYRIDLENETFEVVADIIFTDMKSVTDIIFSRASQRIILLGQTINTTNQEASAYAIYDLAEQAIVREDAIPITFGFVKHPTQNSIFCLTVPNSEAGFRLTEFEIRTDGLLEVPRSLADVEMNSISTHRSTIHTATNSYVVRGGSTSELNPETILYRIDLETGELQAETNIDTPYSMLKVAGE